MGADLSTFSTALQEDYLPAINRVLLLKTQYWDTLAKDGETTGGKYAVTYLQTGENQGVGMRGEKEDLPDAGETAIEKTLISSKTLYGTIELTGELIDATRNSENAATSALDLEQESIMGTFKNDLERQLLSGNGAGRLAQVASSVLVGGNTVVTLDALGALYISKSMLVSFLNAGDALSVVNAATKHKVLSVNRKISPNTITIEGDVVATAVAGKGIYRYMNKDKEFMGLYGMIGGVNEVKNGIFQGVDRALLPEACGEVITDTGAFSPTDFRAMINYCDNDMGQRPDVFWTTIKFRDAYADLLGDNVSYVNVSIVDGAIKAIAYDNVPIRTCKYAKPGRITALVNSTVKFHPLAAGTQSIEWMNGAGGAGGNLVLSQQDNKDVYVARLKLRGEQGCTNPAKSVTYVNEGMA